MYPKNMKIGNVDCIEILESLKSNMIASLRDFQSENVMKQKNQCAFTVLKKDMHYFHLMLKVELLSKISLNFEQKQEEKKNFVDKMTEISFIISHDCNQV